MKKMLCLLVLMSATVHGSTFTGPDNLKGVTVCLDSDSVVADDNAKKISSSVRDALYTAMQTKLRAYRIPFTTNCAATQYDVYVQLDTVSSSSGLNLYSFSFEVYDWFSAKKGAIVYTIGHFGSTTTTGSEFTARVVNSFNGVLDRFAADYATANP